MARTVRPTKLPPAPTILGVYDQSTRRTMNRARTLATSGIQALLPFRSGRLRKATRARVRRVEQGYSLSIIPSKKVRYPERRIGHSAGAGVSARQVARWVEAGTDGPIVPKHAQSFRLPGGWVSGEVAGQAAQQPFERFRRGPGQAVTALIVAGAETAARDIERVLR